MNQAKLKNYIEVATNLAVLVLCCVVLASLAWRYFASSPRVLIQSGFQKGAEFPRLPGVDYSSSPKTLLIAMDSTCSSCSENIPFYKQLAEKQRDPINSTRVFAIFQHTDEQAKQYMLQNHLNLNSVSGVDFKALNLPVIPAVILISRDGEILDFWLGRPSKETEEQILIVLSKDE